MDAILLAGFYGTSNIRREKEYNARHQVSHGEIITLCILDEVLWLLRPIA